MLTKLSSSLLVAFILVVACAAQNYDMQWDADTSVIYSEAQPSPASPTNGSTFDDIMQEIEMMTLQEELQQQDNIW